MRKLKGSSLCPSKTGRIGFHIVVLLTLLSILLFAATSPRDHSLTGHPGSDGFIRGYTLAHPETQAQDDIKQVQDDMIASTAEHRHTDTLAHDDTINATEEAERCKLYGMGFDRGRKMRRRIFAGSNIAAESWHALEAVAAETYGIFHALAFVESRRTHSGTNRSLRFSPGSHDLRRLQGGMFGPQTAVTVDIWDGVDRSSIKSNGGFVYDPLLVMDNLQRDLILERWKASGMRRDDIGLIMDADETFTHDFLLAAQVCDVPEFRPGQDCAKSKILAAALVFEGGPDCIQHNLIWHHPDMVIGECVDLIGNGTVHKRGERDTVGGKGSRQVGYGGRGWEDYSKMPETLETKMYPLYTAIDFKLYDGGRMIFLEDGPFVHEWKAARSEERQPIKYTGFHFHNFFTSAYDIRHKYLTYSHATPGSMTMPLEEISDDLKFLVDCVLNRPVEKTKRRPISGGFASLVGPKPLYFTHKFRAKRAEQLVKILKSDGRATKNDQFWWDRLQGLNNAGNQTSSVGLLTGISSEINTPTTGNLEQTSRGDSIFLVQSNDKDQPMSNVDNGSANEAILIPQESANVGQGNAIVALMTGVNDAGQFKSFLEVLRDKINYKGHILLGVSSSIPPETQAYLQSKTVTFHMLAKGNCSEGVIPEMPQISALSWCAHGFPNMTMETGRFEFYRRWIEDCSTCNGWVLVTDTRDVLFQSDPFQSLPSPEKADKDLLLFAEFNQINTLWFTKVAIERCYDLDEVHFSDWGHKQMLCSGTTMGTRQGILRYLDVLVSEFLVNAKKGNKEGACLSAPYTDQAPHNLLYYTGKFGPKAARMNFGEGPVLTVGTYCSPPQDNASGKNILKVDAKNQVLNPITGEVAAVVHQYDRCWNHEKRRFFLPEDHDKKL